jgi:flavin-dependent thymidylate synthase
MAIPFDDTITDHPYQGELRAGASCQFMYSGVVGGMTICAGQAMQHERIADDQYVKDHPYEHDQESGRCGFVAGGDAGFVLCNLSSALHAHPGDKPSFLARFPHDFMPQKQDASVCGFMITEHGETSADAGGVWLRCGFPEKLHHWADQDRREAARASVGALVRKADVAQYERQPMPDAARKGPTVTLLDAPVDPLGTLAVIGGIYVGKVARSKAEVTDEDRRAILADMQQTVLNGPLEAIQFTFLVEGVSRAITHQMVRNRFSFFAQESLRFAVAEDWAQEVPLPPSLVAGSPAEGVWRKALNAAEDSYNALIGAGVPAEEARGVLPHAITTRLYWTVSLRTLLQEAGKRTCTQAQFDWRIIFSGVARALRARGNHSKSQEYYVPFDGPGMASMSDGWQYRAFADLIRPVCYQQGRCGFMAKFDRGCTIRARVDMFEALNVPSSEWDRDHFFTHSSGPEHLKAIDPAEWAADPGAARVTEGES